MAKQTDLEQLKHTIIINFESKYAQYMLTI